MSFDAGSIAGKLELNNEGFTSSMLEAEGIAHLFPEVVTDFLVEPLLGFGELAKEVGEKVIDTFKEMESEAETINLESIKLGVNPEFLSEWQRLAQTVNVDVGSLVNGLRFLERNAGEAIDGMKGSMKGFSLLGISQDDLGEYRNDVEGLFKLVKERYDELPNQFEKAAAAQELMSRGGAALIPLLEMNADHVAELSGVMDKFGISVDENETKAAQSFNDLETVFSWAMEGIGKAAEKPVWDFFAAHTKQIQGVITESAQWVITEIGKVWATIEGPEGQAAIHWLETEAKGVWKGMKDEVHKVEGGIKLAWAELQKPDVQADLRGLADDFTKVKGIATEWTHDLIAHLPEIISDIREVNDLLVGLLPTLGKLASSEITGLVEGIRAYNEGGLAEIGQELNSPGGTQHQGKKNPSEDTPERRREVKLIHDEFKFDVPHDWTNAEVDAFATRATQKRAGVYRPFSNQYATQDSEDEEATLHAKIADGTATPQDRQRLSQLNQADADNSSPPTVNLTIQKMDVHIGTNNSQHGPMEAAMKKQIAIAMDRSEALRNSRAAIGGSP